MFLLFKSALLLISSFLVSGLVVFGQNFTAFDTQYRSYYNSISKGSNEYYSFYIPANEMGVLTLKSIGYGTDFDLYVYSSNSMSYLIEKSISGGNEIELITLEVKDYSRRVYVKVRNNGSYGKYKFYAHNIDIYEKLAEAVIMAILEGIFASGDDVNDRDLSRGLNLAASIVKNSSLGEATRSFILNELTRKLRAELGYGAVAGFFVTFIVSVYGDVLKNVW